MLPTTEIQAVPRASLHPAFYVASWIASSSVTILFNKYLLSNLDFPFPAILTCWHLLFSTIVTQILARTTSLLDGRKRVKMTGRLYLRAIVPIGLFYSVSLVCSNQTYLYLSVAFIQMLKASAPVAVLITSWVLRVANPKTSVTLNVMVIVLGVALASVGEITFVWIGFFYQAAGIFAEAIRLVMIQILLSGDAQNMDPLVALYYYAPVCTVMNFIVAAGMEMSTFQFADVGRVGLGVLLANAAVAFLLNVASVFLIGKTSGLVMALCGVLKNILLVVASVLIWGTIISGIQIVGYAIALGGLVYYGVGYEGIQAYYTQTQQFVGKVWEGSTPPPVTSSSTRKFVICIALFFCSLLLIMGIAFGSDQAPAFVQDLKRGWLHLDW